GPARRPRPPPPRRAERAAAHHDAGVHAVRHGRLRRRVGGSRVQLAGPRPADLPVPARAGPAGAARRLRRPGRCRRADEPARGAALPRARPEGAHVMTTTETIESPRALAWRRRRRAVAKTWHEFAAQKGALTGLILLAVTVVMALLLPLISDEGGLDVTKADGGALNPPSGE